MSCPICNEQSSWPVPFADDPDLAHWRLEAGIPADYQWRLCRRCGNAYPSHPPDIRVLRRLWASKRGDEGLTPDASEKAWEYRRRISRAGAARSFQQFAPLASRTPGRFLDVGCGLGETVRIFADHGWDAEGIDPDPSTARHHQTSVFARGSASSSRSKTPRATTSFTSLTRSTSSPIRWASSAAYVSGSIPAACSVSCLPTSWPMRTAGRPSYSLTFYPTAASMRYALALAGFEVVKRAANPAASSSPARAAAAPKLPHVAPGNDRCCFIARSPLRYALLGRPYLALRQLAARLMKVRQDGRP